MALKAVIETLDDIDEGTKALYVQGEGGKFYLDLDGVDLKAQDKVKEFRSNNIELQKQLDEMKKKFDGVDPDEFKKVISERQRLEDQKKIDSGKVEELLSERTDRMKKDYDSKIESIAKALEKSTKKEIELHAQLETVLIDSEIQKAVLKTGQPRKGAMEHILNLGKKVWVLEGGTPVAKKHGNLIFGKDPQKPIDFEEWALSLAQDYPYLFEGAQGSDSLGGSSGSNIGKTSADLMKLPAEERLHVMHLKGSQK
jgi:hypothetical protein